MAQHFVCGVDGSDLGAKGVNIAVALANKEDIITVLHVEGKEDGRALKAHYTRPEQPKNLFYKQVKREEFEGDPLKAAFCKAANKLEATLVIMGAHGSNEKSPEVLGSTTTYCCRRAYAPVLVVTAKGTVPKAVGKGNKFLCGVDGTKNGDLTLDLAQSLMSDNDVLSTLHITHPRSSEIKGYDLSKIKTKYQTFQKKSKYKGEFILQESRDFHKVLAGVAAEQGYDFLVMGVDGINEFMDDGRTNDIGSVLDSVLKIAKTHVLIAKDPKQFKK